jgi:asparagine synthase (glutamine-hydrolysing)
VSGFVAVANLDGSPADPTLIRRLTDALAFRGPDAQQIWLGEQVSLGHALFQTTDEAVPERQPCSLNGSVWITGDVRVDRRSELVRALGETGPPPPRTATDPELILLAYEAWGEALIDHLIGDFSFVIWDAKRKRLFCARDQLGVKQFYYSRHGNQLIVSNTLSCIRAHGGVPDKLNDAAVGDFLLFGFNSEPETTMYEAIRCLPAAHTLSWSPDHEPVFRQYWTLPVYEELRLPKPSDYVERFQSVLDAAITDRLRTTCVGVQMSGGIDSSLIAGTAHRLLSRQPMPFDIRAHTVVHDKLFSDPERHFSGIVAKHLNIPIEYVVADEFRLLDARRGTPPGFPEPRESHNRPQLLDTFNQQVAAHSRVALSGWDGDALLTSSWSAHLKALARDLQFGKLASDTFRYVRAKQDLVGALKTRLKLPRRDNLRLLSYPTWFNHSFEERLELRRKWAEHQTASTSGGGARGGAYNMLRHTDWRALFEGFDAGATGVPLDIRHPLLDLRVIAFILSLPAIPWCVDKHIFRAAGKKFLPEAIVTRRKTPLQGDPIPFAIGRHIERCVELFAMDPIMHKYVDPTRTGDLTEEVKSPRYSRALRVVIMNHWLSNRQGC